MSIVDDSEKQLHRATTYDLSKGRGILTKYLAIGVQLFLIGLRFHPEFGSSMIDVFWADGALLAIIVLLALSGVRIAHWYKELFLGTFVVIGLLSAVLLLGILINGNEPLAAFKNLMRIGYFGVAFLFFTVALDHTSSHSREGGYVHTLRVLDVIFLVNIVVVLLQLFDPPVLGDLVRVLYGTAKLRSIWGGYPRVYGTFYNANWFGVFLNFAVTAWLAAWLTRIRSFNWVFVRIAIALILFLLAGTRTGLVGLAAGAITILVLSRRPKVGLVFVVITIAFSIMVPTISDRIPALERTLGRFSGLLSADGGVGRLVEDGSVMGRVSTWETAYEAFRTQPILGFGDNSLNGQLIPHNGYLSLLLTFGITGTTILLAGVGLPVFKMLFVKRMAPDHWVRIWFLSFSVSFMVVNLDPRTGSRKFYD